MMLRRVEAVLRVVATCLGLVGAAMIVAILVLGIADITRRNLLDGRSVEFAVGLQEILLAAATFTLMPWAQMRREHVAVRLLVDRLPAGAQRVVELVTAVGLVLVMAWLAVISFDVAQDAHAVNEVRPGVVSLPTWPVRYLLVAAWSLLTLQFALTAVSAWRRLRRTDDEVPDLKVSGDTISSETDGSAQ